MSDWEAGKEEWERDARDLLARIHRDGGHHTEAVGFKQSCLDAEQEWLALRQRVEELERDALSSAPPYYRKWEEAYKRAEAAEAKLAKLERLIRDVHSPSGVRNIMDEAARLREGSVIWTCDKGHGCVGEPHVCPWCRVEELERQRVAGIVALCVCENAATPRPGCDCVTCTVKRAEQRAEAAERIVNSGGLIHWTMRAEAAEAKLVKAEDLASLRESLLTELKSSYDAATAAWGRDEAELEAKLAKVVEALRRLLGYVKQLELIVYASDDTDVHDIVAGAEAALAAARGE